MSGLLHVEAGCSHLPFPAQLATHRSAACPALPCPSALLQVAELVAACVSSPELAENKCLEVRLRGLLLKEDHSYMAWTCPPDCANRDHRVRAQLICALYPPLFLPRYLCRWCLRPAPRPCPTRSSWRRTPPVGCFCLLLLYPLDRWLVTLLCGTLGGGMRPSCRANRGCWWGVRCCLISRAGTPCRPPDSPSCMPLCPPPTCCRGDPGGA